MKRSHLASLLAILAGLALLAAQPAAASNGMNMIGFGPYSIAMGGADLAVVGSPSAMNINPAGIARCAESEIDLGLSLVQPSLNHSDQLGNNQDDELDRVPMPFVGYVRPIGDLTFGVGLFVQGGMGAEYSNLTTPFAAQRPAKAGASGFAPAPALPATDSMRTRLGHARLTPTIAWRVRPNLALGASLNLSYATIDMELFPETSVRADLDGSGIPGDSQGDFFFGMEMESLSAVGYNLRLGFLYEHGPMTVGGTYSTKTELDFENGTNTLNLTAMGLGKVVYDAEMTNFAWPRQMGLGIAYQIRPRLLIAADLDWLEWSDAIATPTIRVSNPDHPMAPPSREIPLQMGWKDQWVWAAGMEFEPADEWAVRLGYNYGATPVPDNLLRPVFPAIAEQHLTGGAAFSKGPWTYEIGMEYALESVKTNNNPNPQLNPFGPGCQETLSQFMAHFMVRRTLSRRGRAATGP